MKTWRHEDMETWRHGNMDMETYCRDMETWTWRHGHGDMAHGDIDTRRHGYKNGDMEK